MQCLFVNIDNNNIKNDICDFDEDIVNGGRLQILSENQRPKANVYVKQSLQHVNPEHKYVWIRNGKTIKSNSSELQLSEDDIGAVYVCKHSIPAMFTGNVVSSEYVVGNKLITQE